MERRPDSVLALPCALGDGSFFRMWFDFLRPIHSLTDRETDVVAALAKKRHELGRAIKDPSLLDKVLMSDETKRGIREECGMSQTHFQVVMTKLKKSNVIKDGVLNPKFIPKVEDGAGKFQLLLIFTLKDGERTVKAAESGDTEESVG